jgi:hypothetical protein
VDSETKRDPNDREAQDKGARAAPSLKYALGLLAFAAGFSVLSWAEHFWRLRRGDYAGVGMRHTWYWTVTTTWIPIAFVGGWLFWLVVRRWRR